MEDEYSHRLALLEKDKVAEADKASLRQIYDEQLSKLREKHDAEMEKLREKHETAQNRIQELMSQK